MRTFLATFGLGLFSAAVLGCVSDAPANPDGGKQTGQEGGPCFDNFTCSGDLVCIRGPNVCMKPDAGTEAGSDSGSDAPFDGDAEAGLPCITGATAYWPGDGDAKDLLGNYTLTPVGTSNFVAGEVKQAFDLGSVYYTVSTPKFSTLQAMTIEMWIQIPSVPTTAQTVLAYTDNASTLLFTISTNAATKLINFTLTGAGGGTVSTPISTQSFNHIAFVFGGGMLFSYTNGAAQGSGSATMIPSGMGGQVLTVGATSGGFANFVGQLDEIAIYGRALLGSEINDIYKAGSAGRCRAQ